MNPVYDTDCDVALVPREDATGKSTCVIRAVRSAADGRRLLQYPWKEAPREVETALTSRGEEIAKTRARNALKILLDVHGDFGRRTPSAGL